MKELRMKVEPGKTKRKKIRRYFKEAETYTATEEEVKILELMEAIVMCLR